MTKGFSNSLRELSHLSLCLLYIILALCLLFIQGCTAPFRHPVPEHLVTKVRPLQLDGIRAFIDPWNPEQFSSTLINSLDPLLDKHSMSGDTITMLALSGGGDGGAFGAGLLYGWTESGGRPQFDIVTGISTGALMSPFAFLGSALDESLKAVYTGISAENIYEARSPGQMFSGRDALADSKPLVELLKTYVDTNMLEMIGVQHRKGRRLFVGTTHLDSGQLVVWDMGAIAVSGHTDAPRLFRDILLASASIPIAFPPVYISINAGGKQYDEMHVDGGLMNQVFGVETLAHFISKRNASGDAIKAQVFMIRNSEIMMDWQPMPKKLIDIASRTVDTMINSQSLSDIYRNYVLAEMAGIDFYLTGIPASFEADYSEMFDTDYMNELFNVARKMGRENNHWEKDLPGLKTLNTKNYK